MACYCRLARWDQPPSSHVGSLGTVTARSQQYVKVYPFTCELQEPIKVLLTAHSQHGSKRQQWIHTSCNRPEDRPRHQFAICIIRGKTGERDMAQGSPNYPRVANYKGCKLTQIKPHGQ